MTPGLFASSSRRHTGKIKIALDVAASEFLVEDDVYDLGFKTSDNGGARQLAGEELVLTYERLCKTYPIVSIEDPFDQDDFRNTAALTDLGLCQVPLLGTRRECSGEHTRHAHRQTSR